MAIQGLTRQQSDFVERFLKVPKVFNSKAAKESRRAATQQFRLFNAEHDLVRSRIAAVGDPAVQSVMLAQLRAAENIVERDPSNLDFAAGHAQLAEVHTAATLHIRKPEAQAAYAHLADMFAQRDKDHPAVAQTGATDAQSDIALTWKHVQEKYESGTKANNLADLEAALRVMTQLETMLATATKAAKNPFETRVDVLGSVKKEGQKGLDPKVLDARRKLSAVFNRLDALRGKLAAQFGADKIPLDLRMECTATQTKLDAALEAATKNLAGLVEDAEDGYAAAHKAATAVIDTARLWDRDHAAFKVR